MHAYQPSIVFPVESSRRSSRGADRRVLRRHRPADAREGERLELVEGQALPVDADVEEREARVRPRRQVAAELRGPEPADGVARDARHRRVRREHGLDPGGLEGVDIEGRLEHEDAGAAELVAHGAGQRRVGRRRDLGAAVERDLGRAAAEEQAVERRHGRRRVRLHGGHSLGARAHALEGPAQEAAERDAAHADGGTQRARASHAERQRARADQRGHGRSRTPPPIAERSEDVDGRRELR